MQPMWIFKIVAVVALLVETGGANRPTAGRGDPSFYVLSSLQRAMLTDPPPPNPCTRIDLSAARGETQAAQIVVNGGTAGLKSVDLIVSGPLASDRTAAILTVKLYREHYVSISIPSKLGVGGARAGIYPDALIPFRNPFTNARLTPSFDVHPQETQAVYMEVAVPESVAAGSYKGSIAITSAGRLFANVPLTLTVWNFTIPKQPSMHTSFQDYDSGYANGAAKYYGYAPGSPEHASMARAMDALLLEHRLVPAAPLDSLFRVDSDGHIIESESGNRRLTALIDRPGQNVFELSFGPSYPFHDPLRADRPKAITYLREAYRWFDTRGLIRNAFIRTNDEPEKDAEFQQTRALADLIHEANPEWRVAITGGMDEPGFAKYLFGHMDLFIMCAPTFDPVRARLETSRGAEFWSYTAVVQNTSNPSPYWQIDFPLLNFRVMPWINFRYGLRGLLYWTSAYWDQILARHHSPWSDPCSLRDGVTCFNGDGLLIYPGKDVDYVVPESVYGKSVWGPIPTLRLKALRDGMQDYELLTLAMQRDLGAATAAAIEVGCRGHRDPGDADRNCFHDWNTDPDVLLAMRAHLAAVILKQR
ncbi:MAG: glycoside hydrolase domain-containing protein [Bryobacteraceae bacterium]|jgi:hypothetical protein